MLWADGALLAVLRGDGYQPGSSAAEKDRLQHRAKGYEWREDQLVRKLVSGEVRVVPRPIARRSLVKAVHERAGHLGVKKTLSLLRPHYWWVGMAADVARALKGCEACDRVKTIFNARHQIEECSTTWLIFLPGRIASRRCPYPLFRRALSPAAGITPWIFKLRRSVYGCKYVLRPRHGKAWLVEACLLVIRWFLAGLANGRSWLKKAYLVWLLPLWWIILAGWRKFMAKYLSGWLSSENIGFADFVCGPLPLYVAVTGNTTHVVHEV
jgi:hypothetical protein